MKRDILMLAVALAATMPSMAQTVISSEPTVYEGVSYYHYPTGYLPSVGNSPVFFLEKNDKGLYPPELENVAVMHGMNPQVNTVQLSGDVTVPEFVEIEGKCYWVGALSTPFMQFQGESIFIPDAVSRIGENCFYGAALKTLTLPSSLTYIGQKACRGMENIEAIYMRSVVPPVCAVATASGEVTVGVGDELPEGALAESYAFEKGTYVAVPKGSLWLYRQHPVFKTLRLAEYDMEMATPAIAAESAEAGNFQIGMTSNFELQLTGLGTGAPERIPGEVKGADFIMGIPTSEHPYRVTSIQGGALSNGRIHQIIIPATVEMIGDRALRGLSTSSLVVPSSVRYIGEGAFSDSQSLHRVILHLPKEGKLLCAPSAFSGSAANAILYVDKSNQAIDLTARPWSGFKEIRDISELR